eukprot:2372888-Ditylum_brightwellii.AAC.1
MYPSTTAPPKPIAIAHRSYGANLGELPDQPIENTIEAIKAGFNAGAYMAEIDVVVTADGKAVVYHDDYLPGSYTLVVTHKRRSHQRRRPRPKRKLRPRKRQP